MKCEIQLECTHQPFLRSWYHSANPEIPCFVDTVPPCSEPVRYIPHPATFISIC
jgi:hypothetical protein